MMDKLIRIGFALIWMGAAAVGLLGLAACSSPTEDTPLPDPLYNVQQYTPTASATIEPTLTPTATINPLVTLTPTPDPFQDLYLDALKTRTYGGGVLEDAGALNGADGFSRRLFKYRSEGLDMYGFINIPEGEGPFPIIILLHGYVPPEEYKTLDYTVRYTDALVKAGYLTIHPNLRGYSPSASGDNVLGIGDTIDILNLIGLIRQQSSSAGPLEKADSSRIGMWGHSMGGGILLRTLIVDQEIKGGLLYASIHADEEINLAHFEKDGRGNGKVDAPDSALEQMSSFTYLNEITSPISIHHGGLDDVVPIQWSRDLCVTLDRMGKDVQCKEYPEQPHTFQNSGDTEFINNMIEFFDAIIK